MVARFYLFTKVLLHVEYFIFNTTETEQKTFKIKVIFIPINLIFTRYT